MAMTFKAAVVGATPSAKLLQRSTVRAAAKVRAISCTSCPARGDWDYF